MENRTIKISEENYKYLLKIASDLQKKQGRIATFDIAINSLKKCNMKKKKDIMKFAGMWEDMTDEEADVFLKDIEKGWGKWKIQPL